eukprot:GAHX01001685.1.p1 GENE.GAHX01001685.1~~GAHX01001685.1.p1  ORF type:complete len:1148 (-),score=229.84 GAHX01001685.1:24-3467(-)
MPPIAIEDYDNLFNELSELMLPTNSTNSSEISIASSKNLGVKRTDQPVFAPLASKIDIIADLTTLVDEGKQHISYLYAYRSLVKAIPVNDGTLPEDEKNDLNYRSFTFLQPGVDRLQKLLMYTEKATKLISSTFKEIKPNTTIDIIKTENNLEYYPKLLFQKFAQLLDVLIQLSFLIEVRSSIKNDFSFYKRLATLNKEKIDNHKQVEKDIVKISSLLFNHVYSSHSLLFKIKESIECDNMKAIIEKMVSELISYIDSKPLINTGKYFGLIRAALVFILLGEKTEKKLSIVKSKGYDSGMLHSLKKLAKQFSVVPMLGEMVFNIDDILFLCESFEDNMLSQWKSPMSKKELNNELNQYYLPNMAAKVYEGYLHYSDILNTMITQKNNGKKTKDIGFIGSLRWLTDIMIQFKTMVALKYAFPVTQSDNEGADKPKPYIMYQKAIAFNFSELEKANMIKIIYCIRTVTKLIFDCWKYCKLDILNSNYTVIINGLKAIVSKYKDKSNRSKYELFKASFNKLSELEMVKGKLANSFTSNSDQQRPKSLEAISILFELILKGNESTGGFLSSQFIRKSNTDIICEVESRMVNLQFILKLSENIDISTNLSSLWFREYYLDLSKQLEFPIETSLPWMLIKYVIKNRKPLTFVESILSIYNDVCEVSLKLFKKKFLVDECKAECGLVLEKLTFDISLSLYKYYKEIGLELLLYRYTPMSKSNNARKDYTVIDGFPLRTKTNTNFNWLIGCSSIEILGTNVDIKSAVSNHLNRHFRVNLELILTNFEIEKNKQSLLEFNYNYIAIEHAHKEISQIVPIDAFDTIYNEINNNIDLKTGGRFLHSFINDFLLTTVLNNFGYNSATERFVITLGGRLSLGGTATSKTQSRTQSKDANKNKSKTIYFFGKYSQIYNNIIKELCSFVGSECLEILFNIIKTTSYCIIESKLISKLEESVEDLHVFIEQLLKGSPSIRLPQLNYGYSALYGYFEIALKFLKEHNELSHAVFQQMRFTGNLISLIRLITNYKNSENVFCIQEQSALKGDKSNSLFQTAISNLLNVSTMDNVLDDNILNITKKMDSFISGVEKNNTNLMQEAVEHTYNYLKRGNKLAVWAGNSDLHENLECLEKRKDVARFISILLFIFSTKPTSGYMYRTAT